MENRKANLVNSLRTAVHALKNDTVKYDWTKQSCCNAGVVSQVVLGLTEAELIAHMKPVFKTIKDHNKKAVAAGEKKIDATWKNGIKYTCPVTGKGMPQIIQDLEAAGLSRGDIAHLEYLENPAILAGSGIEKEKTVVGQKQVGTREETEVIKKYWGLTKKTVVHTIPVYEDVYDERYPKTYYAERENLIKYLSSWLRILTGDAQEQRTPVNQLEADLLIAVAEENYEKAAEIRDQLAIV
jgi:hypothetical protein